MELNRQVGRYLERSQLDQMQVAMAWIERMERDQGKRFSPTTVPSRLSELVRGKEKGRRFFFANPARADVLLDILEVDPAERTALLAIGGLADDESAATSKVPANGEGDARTEAPSPSARAKRSAPLLHLMRDALARWTDEDLVADRELARLARSFERDERFAGETECAVATLFWTGSVRVAPFTHDSSIDSSAALPVVFYRPQPETTLRLAYAPRRSRGKRGPSTPGFLSTEPGWFPGKRTAPLLPLHGELELRRGITPVYITNTPDYDGLALPRSARGAAPSPEVVSDLEAYRAWERSITAGAWLPRRDQEVADVCTDHVIDDQLWTTAERVACTFWHTVQRADIEGAYRAAGRVYLPLAHGIVAEVALRREAQASSYPSLGLLVPVTGDGGLLARGNVFESHAGASGARTLPARLSVRVAGYQVQVRFFVSPFG